MKNLNKILTSVFILCLFLGFAACTEEVEYSPAEVPAGVQVYFPSTLQSKVELSQDLNVSTYDVELRRIDKDEALTVNLTVQAESPELFTIPTTATFAAGQDVTKITISYNPAALVEEGYDVYKSIRIAVLDEGQTSPYGNSVYTFTAGIPAPWETLGKASFTDAWMFEDTYQVDLQQHMLDPSRYRLIDPYTEGLEEEGYIPDYNRGNQSPYLEFKILPAGSVYKGVTTTENGLVVYDNFYTGYYYVGYSQEIFYRHPSTVADMATEASWLHNIVTQFSSDGKPEVVQLAPLVYMAGVGGWDNTQNDGVVTIVFPGVVLADYSAEIVYTGRFTDAAGDNFAVADVTLGGDVEYAKVAVIQGNNVNSAINGIIDGSIESVQINASGSVSRPCTASGTYMYVVVTYANDEPQDYDYVSFSFTIDG
jgi:hypothetical protein